MISYTLNDDYRLSFEWIILAYILSRDINIYAELCCIKYKISNDFLMTIDLKEE